MCDTRELTSTEYKKINEIMDNFDFRRVYKVMKFLDWAWHLDGKMEVPTESDIRRHARELLERLYQENLYCVECGGFRATKSNGDLSLSFILEDWTYYESN